MRFTISVVYKGKRYRDGPIYHFNVIAKVYLHDAMRSNMKLIGKIKWWMKRLQKSYLAYCWTIVICCCRRKNPLAIG